MSEQSKLALFASRVHLVDGVLTYKEGARNAGLPVSLSTDARGYLRASCRFAGRRVTVTAHRLIWFLTYGSDPETGIDHINGDPADNRIENLRLADQRSNNRNRLGFPVGKTGAFGVLQGRGGVYEARIRDLDGRLISKSFRTLPDAIAWRREKGLQLGYTERHLDQSDC